MRCLKVRRARRADAPQTQRTAPKIESPASVESVLFMLNFVFGRRQLYASDVRLPVAVSDSARIFSQFQSASVAHSLEFGKCRFEIRNPQFEIFKLAHPTPDFGNRCFLSGHQTADAVDA